MSSHPLIEQVFNGMKVFDSAGDNIGKVDQVRLPDPESSESWSQDSWAGFFTAKSRVPETVQGRYRSTGFFHVDGKGWFDTDRYVLANEIDRVEGENVYLNVVKEQLPEG